MRRSHPLRRKGLLGLAAPLAAVVPLALALSLLPGLPGDWAALVAAGLAAVIVAAAGVAVELARRARRIAQSEEHTRLIVEAAREAFVSIDADGLITGWNAQAEATFGWSREEAVGRPLADTIIPPRYREAHRRGLAHFLATGEGPVLNQRIEIEALHRDGRELPVELAISPVRVNGGHAFNAFIHDISERKRAEQQLIDYARALETVSEASRELARAEAQSARPAICQGALKVSEGMLAVLYEPNGEGRELVGTASAGAELPGTPIRFAGPPSVAIKAFTTGEPVFVPDFARQPELSRAPVEATGAASCLGQPVLRHETSVGVLVVAWERPLARLDERLASMMALLAAEAAVAIERADLHLRLEEAARTDHLTGLANRRTLHIELPRELARATRDRRPLCLAMIDLDRFKTYNDAHGHQAGDRVLREVAAAWRDELRATDILVRYGGEEFVAVLPGCTLDEGVRLIERLRSSTPAEQTCSAGVVGWRPDEPVDELLGRADGALYQAKRAGRDCVVGVS